METCNCPCTCQYDHIHNCDKCRLDAWRAEEVGKRRFWQIAGSVIPKLENACRKYKSVPVNR